MIAYDTQWSEGKNTSPEKEENPPGKKTTLSENNITALGICLRADAILVSADDILTFVLVLGVSLLAQAHRVPRIFMVFLKGLSSNYIVVGCFFPLRNRLGLVRGESRGEEKNTKSRTKYKNQSKKATPDAAQLSEFG